MTDDEYRNQIDAEAVAQARSKPWPDRSKVRRVRIEESELVNPRAQLVRERAERRAPHQMAHAANDDREREGATE
jgi:hypothetical protein